MSRFPELVRLFVDYDRALEKRILHGSPALAEDMWKIRDKAAKANLDESRVFTTRDFESAAREVASRSRGDDGALSDSKILESLMAAWTPEERSKATR